MYLLDTNVVSELRKAKAGRCRPSVLRWSVEVGAVPLFISVMTVFEIEKGIRQVELRDSSQALRLRQWLSDNVMVSFERSILAVDQAVALAAAALHVPKTRCEADSLIAATALVHGLTVATRNIKDFQGAGVALLNPWQFGRE